MGASDPQTKTGVMISLQGTTRGTLLVVTCLTVLACVGSDDAEVEGEAAEVERRADGFVAEVTGSVSGRVAAPGVVRFLPPADLGHRIRPGYFFVADGTGVRPLGITFSIPAGVEPGTYDLVSAHPMDAGTAFEVRVDHSVGSRTESFELDTDGTITIDAFPDTVGDVRGQRVAGSFEFETRDRSGRRVEAEGRFDFIGR